MITTLLLPGLIQITTTLVETLLSLRIILKLFGANPVAPFADWIYQTTQPLLVPFKGIFPSPSLTGGFVIEFSSVFALVIYGFIGHILNEVVDLLQTKTSSSRKSASNRE